MDEVLAQSGLFQGLSEDAVDPVASRLETLSLPRGRVVFNEGEPGDSLYIVLNGKVKLGRRSPDGRENLLTIMGPSDMFGELSIFDPGPRTSSATTITEVRAVSMDRDALRAWIADRPEIAVTEPDVSLDIDRRERARGWASIMPPTPILGARAEPNVAMGGSGIAVVAGHAFGDADSSM